MFSHEEVFGFNLYPENFDLLSGSCNTYFHAVTFKHNPLCV